jgi:hypothetical protein
MYDAVDRHLPDAMVVSLARSDALAPLHKETLRLPPATAHAS